MSGMRTLTDAEARQIIESSGVAATPDLVHVVQHIAEEGYEYACARTIFGGGGSWGGIYGIVTNPTIRIPGVVREVLERAAAHPACYLAQTANLRARLERIGFEVGASDAVQRLRVACKALQQQRAASGDRPDAAQE
jgi:hypothetical protein